MNYWKFIFINFLIALVYNIHSFGQGCSDAGFCSLGSMRSSQISDTLHSSIAASQSFGLGEEEAIILTTQLEMKLMPWNNGLISVKVPYAFVLGNLGTTNGLGDLTFSYTHKIIQDDNRVVMLNVGGKIPTNQADKKNQRDLPLPMAYQTSLGTSDLIIGASFYYEDWHFAVGYQHAFNRNENGFLHSVWAEDKDSSIAEEYFESNKFKRGDDIMLRIEKRFEKPKITYFAGLLPVYRIQKDEIIVNGGLLYKDEIIKNDTTIALKGSSSLTVNVNVGLLYKVSKQTDFNISLGFPTIFREVRADGLTRFLNLTVGLEKKFR
ncbi:MAG: hypothetical protein FVQ77_02275 [Cytophagales bacterium]|nr:hypothetical protein [Cytophagales bacterium]